MASVTSSCFASSLIAPRPFRTVNLPFHFHVASFHEGGNPSTASASREQEWRHSHPKPFNPNDLLTVAILRSRHSPPSSAARAPGRRPHLHPLSGHILRLTHAIIRRIVIDQDQKQISFCVFPFSRDTKIMLGEKCYFWHGGLGIFTRGTILLPSRLHPPSF